MSNHSRERAPRVVLAVALVATAAIVSLVSVITSFVLVPALVVSVVCAACGVGVVIAQMTEDRRRDRSEERRVGKRVETGGWGMEKTKRKRQTTRSGRMNYKSGAQQPMAQQA